MQGEDFKSQLVSFQENSAIFFYFVFFTHTAHFISMFQLSIIWANLFDVIEIIHVYCLNYFLRKKI